MCCFLAAGIGRVSCKNCSITERALDDLMPLFIVRALKYISKKWRPKAENYALKSLICGIIAGFIINAFMSV
jgi:hypothetical protein